MDATSMKYRSKLEERIHLANPHLLYEPKDCKLKYTVPHTYQVDFVDPDEPGIYYEAKGRFLDSGEARKYVVIKEQNPDIEIIFWFQNPFTKMPGARKRKDGTVYTMAEWADKHGFRYERVKL